MKTRIDYCRETLPDVLEEVWNAPELIRLDEVGMHCGCEYTSFDLFKGLKKYSRREHSYGVMSIVYHFSHDTPSSLAAAFHDIATPCFSHVIDFLHQDFERQESTEKGTDQIINNSLFIQKLLKTVQISPNQVIDYHQYPIADNDSPKLSADRLEYSLANMINFGFADKAEVQSLYDDIQVSKNEYGETELCFQSIDTALRFGELVLQSSRLYVCKEDRFSMFALSYLIKHAIDDGVVNESDLYLDEPVFLKKLCSSSKYKRWWTEFKSLSLFEESDKPKPHFYRIPAKHRYIDPFVISRGRLSKLSDNYAKNLKEFLEDDFSSYLGHPSFFHE